MSPFETAAGTPADAARSAEPSPGADPAARTSDPGTGAGRRLLMYSHDTFGLGHLRRSLRIGQALKRSFPDLAILLVTGSPVVHRFELPDGMDYVKLPAVRKTGRANYESRSLSVPFASVLELRRNLILTAVRAFDPDFILVDHAPTGMKGEMRPALDWLVSNRPSTQRILGLRDIVDDPDRVVEAWQSEGIYDVLERDFDHILVYGTPEVFDPRTQYRFPESVRGKTHFCHYVADDGSAVSDDAPSTAGAARQPRVTVTIGGGDGAFDTVVVPFLQMMEAEPVDIDAVVVTGPFVTPEQWAQVQRLEEKGRLTARRFVDDLPAYLSDSDLVVCTAGYNTTTEVLTRARRCLMIPRVLHRKEQWLRAERLASAGIVELLNPGDVSPSVLRDRIRRMLDHSTEPVSEARRAGRIATDGCRRVAEWFGFLISQTPVRERST